MGGEGDRGNLDMYTFQVMNLVEIRGLEPLTPSMPWKCSPN